MKQKKITVKLTEKEAFILWSLACWLQKPLVTSSLKYKLYNSKLSDPKRKSLRKKFDDLILNEIVELGVCVKRDYPEWLTHNSAGEEEK